MKLAVIESNGRPRAAVIVEQEWIDLTTQLGIDPEELVPFMGHGEAARTRVQTCCKSSASRLSLQDVRLRAPILHPQKIFGVGMNYHSFVQAVRGIDIGVTLPPGLVWFSRPASCIAGPHDEIWLPRGAQDLDYEGELAIVIGRSCRYVRAAQARGVIAGYTIANDLTLRRRIAKSIVLGKSFDTHTPLGPWLVSADELEDPHQLALRTWVNGALRQESSTAEMIVNCFDLVAELSQHCTLNAGDLILTGTPAGCGAFQQPPAGLAVGDIVRIEIEGLGAIENRVIEEPAVPSVA